jgi:hypothetical protein
MLLLCLIGLSGLSTPRKLSRASVHIVNTTRNSASPLIMRAESTVAVN